ncbi:MAG: Eco47II family restriction endonuclease [Bacteroidota bacterium]
MARLSWITDKELEHAVNHLLLTASEAKLNTEKEFGKNVIDPFSALFEIAGFEIDYNTWIKSETTRQAQKTLQNHIGNFHQFVLGSVDGWVNMETGSVIDLVSKEKKIVAEIKNKYNTVSGGKLADLYNSLEGLVMPKASIYKGYSAYYVAIIPKKPSRYDREFTPSEKEKGEKCVANEKIRETDGASFYSLVTGSKTALEDLFQVLPDAITKCSGGKIKIKEREKLTEFYRSAFK